MTNLNKALISLGCLSAMMLFTQIDLEPKLHKDIKSGTVILECEFNDGWRDVPKEKFVGRDDMTNRWLFTNGSAKNCETYKKRGKISHLLKNMNRY